MDDDAAPPEYDVAQDWLNGNVPHVQPTRPNPRRQLPWVKAGPERLKNLLTMWMDMLPAQQKQVLRDFLSLVIS